MELYEGWVVVLHEFGNEHAVGEVSTDVLLLSAEGQGVDPIEHLLDLVSRYGRSLHRDIKYLYRVNVYIECNNSSPHRLHKHLLR